LKRPGLDEIIKTLGQRCEIVIFSEDDSMFLQSLVPKLDPSHQRISYVLGSESMVLDGTKRVKVTRLRLSVISQDLRYINRELRKVIVLESDPNRLKYHPENGIFIPPFTGDEEDKELYKLIPLLECNQRKNFITR
jgi:TFIIF-interacting CTD phosphatases, including NLI-interacting factor